MYISSYKMHLHLHLHPHPPYLHPSHTHTHTPHPCPHPHPHPPKPHSLRVSGASARSSSCTTLHLRHKRCQRFKMPNHTVTFPYLFFYLLLSRADLPSSTHGPGLFDLYDQYLTENSSIIAKSLKQPLVNPVYSTLRADAALPDKLPMIEATSISSQRHGEQSAVGYKTRCNGPRVWRVGEGRRRWVG